MPEIDRETWRNSYSAPIVCFFQDDYSPCPGSTPINKAVSTSRDDGPEKDEGPTYPVNYP